MLVRLILIFFVCFSFVSPVHAAQEGGAESEAEQDGDFVVVPPISVAMYNKRKRPAGTLTIQMQLQIEDDEQRAEARKIMPRLRSAYTQETAQLATNFFEISRPVNANILGRSLQKITDRVLTHSDARVLIADIAVLRR